MGTGLSCMKSSTSPSHRKRNPKKGPRPINLIGKSSENVQIRYEEQQETKITERSSTLKECLLASPSDHSKIQVFKKELPPYSPHFMSSSEFYRSRKSFKQNGQQNNFEKKEEDEDMRFTQVLERKGSQKLKKKVSFRLPEEADIFVFCSEN